MNKSEVKSLCRYHFDAFQQRWTTPTLELELTLESSILFFIEVEVDFNRNGVELLSFCNSISCHKRRMTEIFDMKRCTCHLQIIYIEFLHLLTITVESLCLHNRYTKETRKRERELRKIFV